MNFWIIVLVCFCASLTSAETTERIWGDVHNKLEFGSKVVRQPMNAARYSSHTFIYPSVRITFCNFLHFLQNSILKQIQIRRIPLAKFIRKILFTTFQAPRDEVIVGIKQIDHNPPTEVKINGEFGDHQLFIEVTADGHDLDTTFIFYTTRY